MTPTPAPAPTDPVARLLASPPDLPVTAALPELRALLTPGAPGPTGTTPAGTITPAPAVVVTAPPGTGKTTLVPPLVADALSTPQAPARVVVTQPRRVAARAAARHLASLLGEEVGQTVGYAVRGERRTSPATRVEVVTAGLLLRRLQHDPGLSGTTAVVLDEVHERSLDSDLLLTLLLDARAALREDLTLIAMSATLDADRLRALMPTAGGGPAPLVEVPGALHPVTQQWSPPPTGVPRLGPRGVPRDFLAHVAATTLRALQEADDDPALAGCDALVFLPGAREVEDVASRLRATLPATTDVLPLHGRLPSSAQDAALSPSGPGRRRVVVATAVAESSLTVPGVRVVVDSTLAREPRLDVARGVAGLVTVGVSRAAGTQRAGRAGREGPGLVHRCCTPADWARAATAPTPEVLTADLTRTALELAAWGTPGGAGLAWLDEPPAAALEVAVSALTSLGLVRADGSVTPLGAAVAEVPAGVREARALLVAAPSLGRRRAAEATAVLTAGLRAPGGDLAALARSARGEGVWRAEVERLERAAQGAGDVVGDAAGPQGAEGGSVACAVAPGGRATTLADAVAVVAALAHPEWVARRRGPAGGAGEETRLVTVGGVGARLPAGSALAGCEWLAVAELDRVPGGSGRGADALVRAAAPLEEEQALAVAAPWLVEEERALWEEGRLRVERVRRLGAVVLRSTPGGAPSPEAAGEAVVEVCQREGLGVLPWVPGRVGDERDASVLRARLALLHRVLGGPWPAVDDDALLARAPQWLVPAVESLAREAAAGRGGRRVDLARLDVLGALRALLPWPEAGRLDELVPERLEVPSGSLVRVGYLGEQGEVLERPVLAVRVQECFGWAASPRVVDGRVPVLLHLLSPARRPVAVTDDLASFWEGPYRQVRSEMRGRYPKHAWPEDPWSVPATRGTGRRR